MTSLSGLETPGDGYSEVSILHTNDLHFAFPHLKTVQAFVQNFRAKNRDVFLFHAGDIFNQHPRQWPGGDLEGYERQARFMVEKMNELGFDAAALGNNELGYHGFVTRDVLRQAKFPLLSANVRLDTGHLDHPEPYVVFKTSRGHQLGVLGLTGGDNLPETVTLSDPSTTVEAFRLIEEQSDLWILLTHIGLEEDLPLARKFGGRVDVIIGGHSHTRVDPAVLENGVLIAQTGGRMADWDSTHPFELGVIRLVLDENGKISEKSGQVLLLDQEGVHNSRGNQCLG
jgi:5'-nucleotidase/UDP-sugar diphosphatase